jgi:molecular chaperone DnaJ
VTERDLYEILGVDRRAAPDDLKRAFRKQALRYHPDRNPDDPAAETSFKEVNRAYEVLSDPLKRLQYDHLGPAFSRTSAGPWRPPEDVDVRELFDRLMKEAFGTNPFRRRKKDRKRRGEDLRFTVSVELEDVATGTEREVSYLRQVSCEACHGSGTQQPTEKTICPDCGGSGENRQRGLLGLVRNAGRGKCRSCHGSGFVESTPCPECAGEGRVPEDASLRVKIPAGVETGQRLKVKEMGNAGVRDARAGELFVVVDVAEHPYFQRRGRDVYGRFPVSFAELALGREVEVPTLQGPTRIRIGPGTQPDDVLAIRGHGLAGPRGGRAGDHHVTLVLEVPTELDDVQRAGLEQLADDLVADPTELRHQVLDLLGKMG